MATTIVRLSRFEDVRDAFRARDLEQALYDEGGVVMNDVLLTLHGDAHRERRRLENRLFRRDTFRFYEQEMVGATIDETLAPAIAAGGADIVPLTKRITLNMTAFMAGIDREDRTPAETERLFEYVLKFSEGATLVHSTRDHEEVRAEVRAALEAYDAEFLAPSIDRRKALLARFAAGELTEDDLPRDVLTTLLRNEDRLHLPHEIVRRETAFYLQAGSHSTANALVHAFHDLFTWFAEHPDDEPAVRANPLRLQRCVHETLRLYPASPVTLRRARAPVTLRSGIEIPTGAIVEMDMMAANRDPAVFGDDAAGFNPARVPAGGVPPWGLTFGGGMHACIGAELDGGLSLDDSPGGDEHLYGTVTVTLQALLDAGARPDPERPPARDPDSSRPHWGTYPVRFDA